MVARRGTFQLWGELGIKLKCNAGQELLTKVHQVGYNKLGERSSGGMLSLVSLLFSTGAAATPTETIHCEGRDYSFSAHPQVCRHCFFGQSSVTVLTGVRFLALST